MPATIGLDVGSTSIKLVTVDGKKVGTAVTANPLGKVAVNGEVETIKLAEVIKKLFGDNKVGIKKARVVLSESLVFSRVIPMPVLSEAELASAIRYEAEQYIPVPLEEVELSYEVLYRPSTRQTTEKMAVLLVASPHKELEALVEVFSTIGLEPESMEPELVAAARAVILNKASTEPVVLCTLGAEASGMGVFDGGRLVFVYRFNSGGTAMARAISVGLAMPITQAEEFKRSYGVRSEILEGKLLAAMNPVIEGLVGELKKAQNFFQQSSNGVKIARLVMVGGVALTPGLVELLSSRLGIEVILGDPFTGLTVGPEVAKLGVVYASAVGAAIR